MLVLSASTSGYTSVKWFKDGVEIPGATSATYTKENVTLEDAGKYKAVFQTPSGEVSTNEATVTVKPVIVEADSITLDKVTLTLDVEKSEQLKATVLPANTTNKKVTWKSLDNKIASVTTTGMVKGVAKGIVDVTATTSNGKVATCKVTVNEVVPDPDPEISVEGSGTTQYLKKGDTKKLKVTTTPDNAEWEVGGDHDATIVDASKE